MSSASLQRGDRVRYVDRHGETHIALIDRIDGDQYTLSLDRNLGAVIAKGSEVSFFDHGPVVRFKPGDIVRSTKDAMSTDWLDNKEARRRPWGLVCTVQLIHDSHGLTYEVTPRVAQISDTPAVVPIIHYTHEELEAYDPANRPQPTLIGRKPEW